MTETRPHRRIGRSVLAVLVGMVVDVALTMVGFDGALLLATLYRTVYGVLSSYITAWLAPSRPMGHALVGGGIGLAASIVGAVVTWNKGPAFGPHWYPLALVVLALPTAWVGGKLRMRQSRIGATQ